MTTRRGILAIAVTALVGTAAALAAEPAFSLAAGTTHHLAGSGTLAKGHGQAYTIGLFGDLPYGAAGRAEFPALRADINAAHVSFSLFDGDLKNGKELCNDALYTDALARFTAFTSPVVAVPGDNDWTDCHRANNGGYDPQERLTFERTVLYSTPKSLGQHPITVARQGPEYPENERFSAGPVTYVGLNVQGSNNNFAHLAVDGENRSSAQVARQDAEYQARNAADIGWLDQAFATAKARGDKAVMVWWQADPNFTTRWRCSPRSTTG